MMQRNVRELYFKIIGNSQQLHDVAIHLHFLDNMCPREKLEPALKYLVRKGITGNNFIEWYRTKCKGSDLEMLRELTRAVERDLRLRHLTVKDILA